MNNLPVQVNPEHYFSKSYLSISRFQGLYGQIFALGNLPNISTLLEIGPGPGFFSAIVKSRDIKVTTLDVDPRLSPDIVGSVSHIPFIDCIFDAVCAFEVLEHLPLNLLQVNLSELSRVAKTYIVLSLPNVKKINYRFRFEVFLKIKNLKWKKNIHLMNKNCLTNPQEHYWEIGVQDVTLQKIEGFASEIGLKSVNTFFVEPWFQFFVFEKT